MGRVVLASFTYYGRTPREGRRVDLTREDTSSYSVSIVGYPELRSSSTSFEKVLESFTTLKAMSIKDWGSSEIDWTSDLTSTEQEKVNSLDPEISEAV